MGNSLVTATYCDLNPMAMQVVQGKWPPPVSYTLKQKHNDRTENEVAESNDWMSPGYANAGSSPVPTPPSGKGLKASTKPKATKGQKSGPQTPLGFGSPGNPSTPVGGCRYDSSLGLLTKFLNLLKGAPGGIVDLNNAAETLELITAEMLITAVHLLPHS
ncbi:transcription factor E2FA-like [Zea mays]|uniref:transcription factor E2FA-like n=1 Tax=Zea mays TaxID=4577 RepID=UPI0004DEB23C|nr:transcription factor E2FA-like [Zea mays]|eukprot:XP_008671368.1 transcription factor E2FA-like [Zea mays]